MVEDNGNNNNNQLTNEKKMDNNNVLATTIMMMDEHGGDYISGWLRGIAAAFRKVAMVGKKIIVAKGPAVKSTIRSVGEARPLAFASEGAVAGESILPRIVYYGAWGLSGLAISADIYTKQDDAPAALKWNTVYYWTAFHIPASLVVPAYIIHQIVHHVEHAVQRPWAKSWSPRAKSIAPVGAALLSIIPVVPVVDYAFETAMEPTLGAYLGLQFNHHHNHSTSNHVHDDSNIESTSINEKSKTD